MCGVMDNSKKDRDVIRKETAREATAVVEEKASEGKQ